jgi:diguanylate cyclase (GGDEF)-like protein
VPFSTFSMPSSGRFEGRDCRCYPDLVNSRGQHKVDRMTVILAKKITECIHDGDFVGRIAGGDFALLVKRASPGDTFMLAERLRSSAKDIDGDLTLSLGVAAVDELNAETAHELFVAASTALHRARSRGGNCAVLCTHDLLREPKSTTRV